MLLRVREIELSYGVALVVFANTLPESAPATESFKEVEVSVPAALPSIIITDPGAPTYKLPRSSGLAIKLQVSRNGEFKKPKDMLETVLFVRRALPSAYLEELAYAHGMARPGFESDASKSPRIWELDLSQYLYKIWGLDDRKTRLGRQMACINWGEFSLQALYTEVANDLPEDQEFDVRKDIPEDYEIYAVRSLAYRLLYICSQTK
jgi:hypothetical protein